MSPEMAAELDVHISMAGLNAQETGLPMHVVITPYRDVYIDSDRKRARGRVYLTVLPPAWYCLACGGRRDAKPGKPCPRCGKERAATSRRPRPEERTP